MIIDMPNTRTREIAHKIEQLHEERGESATGPRADAAHRHRGRGPRACAGNRELGQP